MTTRPATISETCGTWMDEHGTLCGKPAAVTVEDEQETHSYCAECWAATFGEPTVDEVRRQESTR
jgi:hypothetical protein